MPTPLKSLHGMLLSRLLAVALAVSVVVGVVSGLTEQDRVRAMVRDRAVAGASGLRDALQSNLDTPGLGDRAALQAALDAFAKRRQRASDSGSVEGGGEFVALRVYDAHLTPVAQVAGSQPERQAVLASLPPPAPPPAGNAPLVTDVTPDYVRVVRPLTNSQGAVTAYADGLFAVSAAARAEGRRRVWRAVFTSILIVLATTAVLYPVIIRLMRRLERLSRDLLDAGLEMFRVAGSLIAKRDSDTDIHNFRVTLYSVRIAEAMGLDARAIRTLIKGAFLHDVGKVGTPDRILHKPGKLDEVEYSEMKRHVNHGLDVVERTPWLAEAAAVVGGHHEKYDGSGYPRQLQGDAIPLLARIFAVADVFDALASRRPYKQPLEYDKVLAILMEGRGTHFDPRVLDVFAGVARPLYDSFANRDDTLPRQEVARIVERYFHTDVAALL